MIALPISDVLPIKLPEILPIDDALVKYIAAPSPAVLATKSPYKVLIELLFKNTAPPFPKAPFPMKSPEILPTEESTRAIAPPFPIAELLIKLAVIEGIEPADL